MAGKQKREYNSVLDEATEKFFRLKPDEIAELMRKNGIHGRPGTAGTCPMANFLNAMYTGRFLVGPKGVIRVYGRGQEERVACTPQLRQFIRGVDLMRYPDLIAPPPRVLPKPKRKKAVKKRTYRGMHHHPAKSVGRWPDAKA